MLVRRTQQRVIVSAAFGMPLFWIPLFWIFSVGGVPARADQTGTQPDVGIRSQPARGVLLKGARVVLGPTRTLDSADILIRETSIVAVGTALEAPAGVEIVDREGQTIYPGLIDAFAEIGVDDPPAANRHWNGYVVPQRQASEKLTQLEDLKALRSQGITIQLIAPDDGILKGQSAIALLGETPERLVESFAQHFTLTVPRRGRRDSYPNSPMGATALVRQVLADADWYQRAMAAYQAGPDLPRPQVDAALQVLAAQRGTRPFIADAANERMVLRADEMARAFSLNLILRGSGREYRDLNRIAATGRALLVPVNFPKAPAVASEVTAQDTRLRDLMHWFYAPENPARLAEAGVTFCLTSDGLEKPKDFLKQVRVAVDRGLAPEQALAAMTTVPASLMGIDNIAGEIKAGTLANLIVCDGDLFDKKTKVLETWVAGQAFRTAAGTEALETKSPLEGEFIASVSLGETSIELELDLEDGEAKLELADDVGDNMEQEDSGEGDDPKDEEGDQAEAEEEEEAEEVGADEEEGDEEEADDEKGDDEKGDEEEEEEDEDTEVELQNLARSLDRLTATADLSKLDDRFPQGPSRLTIVVIGSEPDALSLFSTLTTPDGVTQTLSWKREDDDGDDDGQKEDKEKKAGKDEKEERKDFIDGAPEDLGINYPLGAYGRLSPADQVTALIRGASVWTCEDDGILENADVLIRDGKIAQIGTQLSVPEGAWVIDAAGKHLTPGIIDCHSHMATDGGVNESGQAVTAEVRVGDFIDNTDINIYRQLAGGVTAASILHGSANPIGGQNQVIKLRWGAGMDECKLEDAPGGIKFALGENVKRSNGSSPQTRYPASRMGVEQILRDRLLAAREYTQKQDQWREGKRDMLPPRIDFELEALSEILAKTRWIHCHSYRQDEIVALLDLLDSFGVRIGTLQHILEGYKVADRLARHGAMASSFADWWAYKFEVYDAIPHNGAVMHQRGIVVSFNSDDAELARHLNHEAAKAVKYGGVSREEALKFVTLNPAKQLRIENRTGSIKIGKDADLALWSGDPLSNMSRCEQTWVDGRCLFSLQQDARARERNQRWKAYLISKILDGDFEMAHGHDHEIDEESRWLRYDEFCHDHTDHDHGHAGHGHGHEHN
ncbi:MAG: amidohydrolase family protein [Planctomycetota bacterium]